MAAVNNKDHIHSRNKEMIKQFLQKKREIEQCKELNSDHLPHIIAEKEIENFKAQKKLVQSLMQSELDLYTSRTESRWKS